MTAPALPRAERQESAWEVRVRDWFCDFANGLDTAGAASEAMYFESWYEQLRKDPSVALEALVQTANYLGRDNYETLAEIEGLLRAAIPPALAAQPAPDLETALERAMRVELCDCGEGAERDREHDVDCRILALRSADPHFLECSIAAVLPLLQAERARGGSREHGMLSTGLGRGSGAASDVSRLDAAESAPLPTGAAGENAGNNPQAPTPEQPREPTPELRAAVVSVVHSAVVSLIDSKRLDPPATTDEIASMVAERVVETLAGFRWESAAEALRLRAALESARDTMTWFTIDHDERRVPGTLTCRLCEEKERATAALAQPASADAGALGELVARLSALANTYIKERKAERALGVQIALDELAAALSRLGLVAPVSPVET